jgi:hypothetical protein
MSKTSETGKPATLLDVVRAAHRLACAQSRQEPSAEIDRVRIKLQICEEILRSLEPPAIPGLPGPAESSA